jgi:hypothetical protein
VSESLGIGGHPGGFAATLRADRWWAGPLLTVLGLGGFVIYATWAAFQGSHYFYGPGEGFGGYLSPFYSPPLFVDPAAAGAAPLGHSWLGAWPAWWPSSLPASPALLILIFPGVFRATCYYYRKAYYRSFFGTPPGCAVGPIPRRDYRGETGLLLVQNLHRYALYFAILFIVVLSYDAVQAFFRDGRFGVGIGSLVLLINPILLSAYTFGCHSFRHLAGGRADCFSCEGRIGVGHALWRGVSSLNARHMEFAWVSLFWVAFADVYVRLVSMGHLHDVSTWN